MTYQVKTEKVIAKPVAEVFRALKEGRLFFNCGADSAALKIDFRVGGKYHMTVKSHGLTNHGEFLEIVPNRKVVFSWCQEYSPDAKPDTQVTIELFEDGPKTRLTLLHAGFNDKENCDNHEQGWNSAITDMGEEIALGRIRLVRVFKAPMEKLYAAWLASGASFVKGGKLTLAFDVEEEGGSSVEILHEGLVNDSAVVTQRASWESLTEKIASALGER